MHVYDLCTSEQHGKGVTWPPFYGLMFIMQSDLDPLRGKSNEIMLIHLALNTEYS